MSEPKISDDFKQLGDNLIELLRATWDRPERAAIQSEIEKGLTELGSALNQAAAEFSESEVGQKIIEDVSEIKSRVQSGEAETVLREDVKRALDSVNKELENLAGKIRKSTQD